MNGLSYSERSISQQPAIDLLQSLGYVYLSPADCAKQRGSRYHVLLRDILRGQLRRLNRYSYAGAENEFSAANIERAMEDLDEPLTDGLVRASEKIYDALMLGRSYPETVGDGKMLSFNLKYIDWERPENNLYCDAIDNREYEPLMQNLLDTHLSVAGLRQLTDPIDILNKDDFEKALAELGSLRAKADAISSRLSKSISEKYDENPAYYDSFSKRIKQALNEYREKVITEAEYLAKMQSIMEDYHAGRSTVSYPASISNNVHAQAFYGVIAAIFDAAEGVEVSADFAAEMAIAITRIVEKHSQVDWTNNKTIHDRISQDIDDLFYTYEKQRGLKLSFDVIDKIIENVKTVALRRF